MATYRKRGDAWRVEVAKNGIRRSATFDTKTEAVSWATKLEAEILDGKIQQVNTSHTLADALVRYRDDVSPMKKGARWETLRLNNFIRTLDFAGVIVDRITTEMIGAFRDGRLKQVKNGTVNREMNLLSAVFEECVREWRWCSSNPCNSVRRPKDPPPRDKRISDKMLDTLSEAMGYEKWNKPKNLTQRVAMAMYLAIETGMRSGEIVDLTPDRVFLDQSYVKLAETKNGDARNVPLSSTAVQILRLLMETAKPGQILGVTSDSRDAIFRKGRQKAILKMPELSSICFHDTRHEAITRLAKKLDVLALARMIGHRDIRSLMIYYNEHASDIASRLG